MQSRYRVKYQTPWATATPATPRASSGTSGTGPVEDRGPSGRTAARTSCSCAPSVRLLGDAGDRLATSLASSAKLRPMGWLEERAGLTGKVAFIAGGGGGLGRAIALDYARAGMRLLLCDKNEELLERTVRELGDDTEVMSALIDVRDADVLTQAFADGLQRFGRLDVLVNVAGGTFKADFVDTNRAWVGRPHPHQLRLAAPQHPDRRPADGGPRRGRQHHHVDVDRGPSRRARVRRVRRDEGRGHQLLAHAGARARAALASASTASLPTTRRPKACPRHPSPRVVEAGVPMGRLGTYEDIGGCALFLASDLSNYVTGTTLHPDGGAFASAGWFNWPGLGYLNMPPTSAFGPRRERAGRLTSPMTSRQATPAVDRAQGAGPQPAEPTAWTGSAERVGPWERPAGPLRRNEEDRRRPYASGAAEESAPGRSGCVPRSSSPRANPQWSACAPAAAACR